MALPVVDEMYRLLHRISIHRQLNGAVL